MKFYVIEINHEDDVDERLRVRKYGLSVDEEEIEEKEVYFMAEAAAANEFESSWSTSGVWNREDNNCWVKGVTEITELKAIEILSEVLSGADTDRWEYVEYAKRFELSLCEAEDDCDNGGNNKIINMVYRSDEEMLFGITRWLYEYANYVLKNPDQMEEGGFINKECWLGCAEQWRDALEAPVLGMNADIGRWDARALWEKVWQKNMNFSDFGGMTQAFAISGLQAYCEAMMHQEKDLNEALMMKQFLDLVKEIQGC